MKETANIAIRINVVDTGTGQVTDAVFSESSSRFLVNSKGDLDFSTLGGEVDIVFSVDDQTGHNIRFKKDQKDDNIENDAIWVAKGIQCPTDVNMADRLQFQVQRNPDEEMTLRLKNLNFVRFLNKYTYRLNFIGRGAGTGSRRYWLDPMILNRGGHPFVKPPNRALATVAVVAIAVVAIVAVVELQPEESGDVDKRPG